MHAAAPWKSSAASALHAAKFPAPLTGPAARPTYTDVPAGASPARTNPLRRHGSSAPGRRAETCSRAFSCHEVVRDLARGDAACPISTG